MDIFNLLLSASSKIKKEPDVVRLTMESYMATANRPVMSRPMFEGVKESGMLQEYYRAAMSLHYLAELSKKLQSKSITEAERKRTVGEYEACFRSIVRNLETKKDCIFIDQEKQELIDTYLIKFKGMKF